MKGWHLRFYDQAKHGILTTPAFEGDLIESALSMSLKSQSVLFFFNCGITDRFGVSVVVPIPNVDVEATNTSSGPPRL